MAKILTIDEDELRNLLKAHARMDHMGRCLIQGCYYGTADRCQFCDAPRPPDYPLAGHSPLESFKRLAGSAGTPGLADD